MRSLVRTSFALLVPSLLASAQEPATAPIDTGRLRPSHEQFLEEQAEAFSDPDPDRRRAAVLRLARAGDAATPVVIERLASTRNPLGQRSALLALVEIGTPSATAALERAMESDALKEDERTVLMLALGVRGVGAAIPVLREAATSGRATPLRRAATLALGRLGDGEGLLALLDRLPREPIVEQRAAVVVAAGAVGDRRFLPSILPALGDDDPAVRRAAAFAVGEIGEPVELELLLAQGRRERDEQVRAAVALAWGRVDHPAALDALERAAGDRAEPVRAAAWAALAARPDGAARVAEALGQERSAERRLDLARAAAAGAGEALAEALLERLSDRKAGVRAAAGRALAALGVDGEPQTVLDWLGRETDDAARRDAVLVVGVLDLPGALDLLTERPLETPLGRLVDRALRGRLDPRVLDVELERRLAEEGGRLEDRRDAELAVLVARVLDLDDVVRRLPGADGGPGPVPPGGKARVDRRASSYERDLLLWFEESPYFPPADARARAR